MTAVAGKIPEAMADSVHQTAAPAAVWCDACWATRQLVHDLLLTRAREER